MVDCIVCAEKFDETSHIHIETPGGFICDKCWPKLDFTDLMEKEAV